MQAAAAEELGRRARAGGRRVDRRDRPRAAARAARWRACARPCGALATDAGDFSEAILTSDAGPKRACLEVALPSGTVRLAAQAKGAGMISPRFATMFCFVQTDAGLDAETLDLLTGVCVKRSFDRISVDGQLSTSDTVFVARRAAPRACAVEPETPTSSRFGEAMDALLRQLALEIVRDGEGAERVGPRGRARRAPRSSSRSRARWPTRRSSRPRSTAATRTSAASSRPPARRSPPGEPFVVGPRDRGAAARLGRRRDRHRRRRAGASSRRPCAAARSSSCSPCPGEGGETEVFFSDLSEEYVTSTRATRHERRRDPPRGAARTSASSTARPS